MYWIFLLLYVMFFIFQLFYLYKSIKIKDNKYWTKLLNMIIGSMASCIIIVIYEILNSYNVYLDGIIVLLCTVIAIIVYSIISLLGIIFKFLQKHKLKNKEIIQEKKTKKNRKQKNILPILYILIITIALCFMDFLAYEYKEIVENNRYQTTKQEKIDKMINYINNKYDMNYTIDDNIFYREYKYSEKEMNEKKHDDFYIGIFDNGEEKITVSINKNNFLSDNAQIDEIGIFIKDYFTNKIGVDIEYVIIKNPGEGYEDDLINSILQFKFNNVINKDNIEEFINEILKENVEFIFYVKDTDNREKLIEKVTTKLSFLEDNNNVKSLAIYLFDPKEELIIEKTSIIQYGDYWKDEIHLNYYSSYMFGFVYVPNSIEFSKRFEKENTFNAIAFYNKKYAYANKYENDNTNDWTIHEFK